MEERKSERILEYGLARGADFVEIYEEEARNASVTLRDSQIEAAQAGTDYGIGLRLCYGTEVLYAHTGTAEERHLLGLIDNLAQTRGDSTGSSGAAEVHLVRQSIADIHPVGKDPAVVGQSPKPDLLRRADGSARSLSPKIKQVSVGAVDSVKSVLICNSEGLRAEERRIRTRFSISVTAESGNERFSAMESPGARRGFEFFEELPIDELAERAARRALLMLEAGYIEGGKMPVVLGNGFGGVIFHEACGHPLETEAIRKKASPFVGKLGEKIAHEAVTAIDDGTIPNSWGSLNIDDEGFLTRKTILIERGILRSYMSDRIGALETAVERTGSGRRESYRYAPVSRMRNTYIDRGDASLEEMLAGIEYGLYARKMGGGSVNPATGEFNFTVEEGYIIRRGKIGEAVRGATLIGKGHEILPRISLVGDDLELAAGSCGAASGMVPVTVGQPTLKVDEILVGGR